MGVNGYNMDKDLIICGCGSSEHIILFWYDEQSKFLYTEVHLTTYHSFFKRLWYGLKYAFGYKSRYGCFDECLFEEEQQKQLYDFLNKINGSYKGVNTADKVGTID